MAEINPYAAQEGFTYMNALLNDQQDARARRAAGGALAQGDYGMAAQALGGRGMLDEQVALMGAQREQEQGQREQVVQFLGQAIGTLRDVPEAQRPQVYQQLRPTLENIFDPQALAELDRVAQTQGGFSDQNINAFAGALGVEPAEPERRNPPSGYEWAEDGSLRAIRGGPADRWTYIAGVGWVPPGAGPPELMGGQGGQGGPQPGQPTLSPTLPWGNPGNPSQPGGGQPRPGSERSQTPTVQFGDHNQARQEIARLVPGVTFTSGPRTPDQNRAARGAARSYHLQSRAWDLVPPRGMTMAQLADRMRQAGFRVLNEGDHVHVSW